jgi:hypothetical protein
MIGVEFKTSDGVRRLAPKQGSNCIAGVTFEDLA